MDLFSRQLGVGSAGEEAVKAHYLKKGAQVIDVTNDAEYRKKDIDLIINAQTVEVKTGQNIAVYGDLVVELESNSDEKRYRKGWLYTTGAEVLIFYSPQKRLFYQILTEDLRQIYEENKQSIQTKYIAKNEF